MALVLADRVKDTTTTTGTGTVTLSGTAPTGYQNFAVIGNGNTTYYTIAGGSEWEVGIGTYATSGPTLARTTVLASTNGGSAVSFSSGTKDVFVTYPAEVATALGNPTATNGGVVYGTGTAVNVSAAGTVSGYQFLQSAGAASPTWVQINSFKDVATAPTSPTPIEGDRFFDNTTGIDYTYITDVDGSQWVETAPGNLASVAGGSSTQVQYNNAGILGGITGATTNGTVLTLTTPVLGAATGTSLALGGATLGTNALAVTGTTALSGLLTGAGGVSSTLTTDATSTTTGSIITAGGISTQKALWVGTTSNFAGAMTGTTLALTKASAGDALTWTNGGATPKTGYLYSDSGVVAMFNVAGAGAGRNGIQISSTAVTLDINAGTNTAVFNASGLGIGMTPSNVLDITQNQNAVSYGKLLNSNGGGSAQALWQVSNGTNTTQIGQLGTANAPGGFYATGGGYLTSTTNLGIGSGGVITFGVNNTTAEVARFDTTGQFFVGVTTSWSQARIDAKATGVANSYNAVSGWNSGSGGAAIIARVDNTAAALVDLYYSTVQKGTVKTDGTNIAYNAVGALIFGTNGSTEAARFDTSGRFTVGSSSSPDGGNITAFTTGVSSAEMNIVCASGTANKEAILNFGSTLTGSTRYSGRIYYRNTDNTLRIWAPTTTTDALILDTSGRLGIGMTPTNVLDITQSQNAQSQVSLLNSNASSSAMAYFRAANGTTESRFGMMGTGTSQGSAAAGEAFIYSNNNFSFQSSGVIKFAAGSTTEVARFNAYGYLHINQTTNVLAGVRPGLGLTFDGQNAQCITITNSANSSAGAAIRFIDYLGNYTGGGIYYSASNNINYSVSSDERLKNWEIEQRDYRSVIAELWVGDFTWKSDDLPGFGIRAQQAYPLYPHGINKPTDDGNWASDYGKLAPLALWGVKDLYKIIDELTTRLAALEAK